MKKFLTTLFNFLESVGQARAASYYTRAGNYQAAIKIMSK